MHPLSAEGAEYGSALPDVTGAEPTGEGLGTRVRALSGEQKKKKKKEKKQREEVPDLREEARTGQEVEYAPRRKNVGRRGVGDGGVVKKVWEGCRHLARLRSTGSFHHEEATALEDGY